MLEITPLKFEDDKLMILDQTELPNREVWMELETREDVWDAIKKLKGSEVSEDEISDLEDELQKITEDYCKKVEKAVEEKTREIMEI